MDITSTEAKSTNVPRKSTATFYIPFDVLSAIFQLACLDSDNGSHPEDFLYICKWWNAVAMQNKRLWNRIQIVHPGPLPFTRLMSKTTAYLTRSGECPLDINITCARHTECSPRPSRCPMCRQHCHEIIQLIGVTIGENEEHIERWRTLVLDCTWMPSHIFDIGHQSYDLFQLLLTYSMPRLKSLDLTTQESSTLYSYGLIHLDSVPKWIQSHILRQPDPSPPAFPELLDLSITGNQSICFNAELSPRFTSLHLKTDSVYVVHQLLQNPALEYINELYLSGWISSPYNSGVEYFKLVEKAVNVQKLIIAPSLETEMRRILQENNRLTQVIVISPAPPYDDESDEEEWTGWDLFD